MYSDVQDTKRLQFEMMRATLPRSLSKELGSFTVVQWVKLFLEGILGKVKGEDCVVCSLCVRHYARHWLMCCHILVLTVLADRLITAPCS